MGNCSTCTHITTEDAGDDHFSHPFEVCDLKPGYSNLKSFPFKKDMPCFQLEFWHSEFADEVGPDDESYNKAIDKFKEKYR